MKHLFEKLEAIQFARTVVETGREGLLLPAWAEQMTPSQAALLEGLLRAYPRVLEGWYLEEQVIPKKDRSKERNPKIVDVYVSRIREALGFDVIETVHGYGFRCGKAFHDRNVGGPNLEGLSGWL